MASSSNTKCYYIMSFLGGLSILILVGFAVAIPIVIALRTFASEQSTSSTASLLSSTTSVSGSTTSVSRSTTSTSVSTTTSTSSSTTSTSSSTTSTSSSTTSTSSSTTSTSTSMFSSQWNKTGLSVAGSAGMNGSGPNQLFFPTGLALDSSNTLYITDNSNHRIQAYLYGATSGITVAGQANGTFGATSFYLYYPNDVTVDENGTVYVADTLNHRVQSWRNGSTFGITVAGNGSAGSSNNQLNTPRGITRDPNTGFLYIADTNNHRVMKYTPNVFTGIVVAGGNGPGTNNTQLLSPRGLYFDSSTNSLIIANTGANNIVRWVLGASNWTLVAGNINGLNGSGPMALNTPYDVILDFMGNVYVADTNNMRIQFYFAGQMNGTTIAGITGIAGSNSTLLTTPRSVVLDNQYVLYVSDGGNQRILKFQR